MKAQDLRNIEEKLEEMIGQLTDLKLEVMELRQEYCGVEK